MGGGPASSDVVRASCILTFPESTMIEPVPIDAWYLHAVGLTFLRRLARDRVNEGMRITLIMQRMDSITNCKRYISVSSNEILRDALKETFEDPERVLVLHIIAMDKVLGQRRIHVRHEVNPNVSPEPVEPMQMVFPTLAVEDQHEVPMATPLPMNQTYDCLKSNQASCLRENEYVTESGCDVSKLDHDPKDYEKSQVDHAKSVGHDEIPLARVVTQDPDEQVELAEPSDFVMLDLQHGAGLEIMPATETSTFFISSNWHVHEDDMDASSRFNTGSSSVQLQSSNSSSSNEMEDSFIILDSLS